MNKKFDIPEPLLDDFCFYLKDKIIEFYKNPANQAEFEKWLSKRNLTNKGEKRSL